VTEEVSLVLGTEVTQGPEWPTTEVVCVCVCMQNTDQSQYWSDQGRKWLHAPPSIAINCMKWQYLGSDGQKVNINTKLCFCDSAVIRTVPLAGFTELLVLLHYYQTYQHLAGLQNV